MREGRKLEGRLESCLKDRRNGLDDVLMESQPDVWSSDVRWGASLASLRG
jgi:hypothetical protein